VRTEKAVVVGAGHDDDDGREQVRVEVGMVHLLPQFICVRIVNRCDPTRSAA
jgi:hypothetical protein